ncbi:MAG TPA: hypothetical protein VIM73_15900, partial [Polyangiaceae bacterium]
KIVRAPVLTVRTRLFYARRELVALLREEPSLALLADRIDEPPPLRVPESPPGVSSSHKEPA